MGAYTVNNGKIFGLMGFNKSRAIPSLILRVWKNNNYYLYSTDVPYYGSYSSEIPELETSSISISDTRCLGYSNNYGSYNYVGVYIMIETNSDGAVSINQEAIDEYAGFSSEGNGKHLVSLKTRIGDEGTTVTKDLIITVGGTGTYEELSKTLSITFVNGSGTMDGDGSSSSSTVDLGWGDFESP